jgi:hypothetical protein
MRQAGSGTSVGEFQTTVMFKAGNEFVRSLAVFLVFTTQGLIVQGGQSMADSLQNFDDFVQSLSSARPEQFSAAPGAKVESAAAFEAMQQYLLNRY